MLDEKAIYLEILWAVHRKSEDRLEGAQHSIRFTLSHLLPLLSDEVRRHGETVIRVLDMMVRKGVLLASGSPTTYMTTKKFDEEIKRLLDSSIPL